MVADLQRAGQDLSRAGQRLGAELSTLCIPASSGQQVIDVGVWADEQVADLRRRLTTIQQTHDVPTITQATAAFGLFGKYAPDWGGIADLTAAAGKGDAMALKTLVDMQNSGKNMTLAARLNAWWGQLSPEARNRLIATSPSLVGSLDGLPATVRDQANRKFLAESKAEIADELSRLQASSEEATKAIEGLKLKMRQIASVEKGLARGGKDGIPPALLLQLELEGRGKTAISYGNPDEADNIAVYVPGTGTILDGFGDDDAERATVMWQQAHKFQESKTHATIAWLGYEAPQWGVSFVMPNESPAAMFAALNGAPLLASFTDGLRAAHKPASSARLTVLGHSYGSTVTGAAAQRRPPGAFADQVIFVGSPGVSATKAKDLGVNAVWVGEAPNDPVGDFGSIPSVPVHISKEGGMKLYSKESAVLGIDPSDSAFGAKQFYVEDSGDSLSSFKAHSLYWNRRSVSLMNIGHLINGQYDALVPFPKPAPVVTPPPPTAPPSPAPRPVPTESPSPHPLPSPSPAGE
ncbi:alpha/beta hydrolase [Streptosporangium sp. NPDC051022]|uniref:alpha/beta hydrolase n=1 Tax=Streptosporangium sp. NPDC051022 TaxID=3155752 RepID=UPI00343C8A8F